MKTREESARFVETQFYTRGDYKCKLEKNGAYHYGKQEVRELIDFIFDGEPDKEIDKINGRLMRNGQN